MYVCVRAMMLIEVEDEWKLLLISKVRLQRQDFVCLDASALSSSECSVLHIGYVFERLAISTPIYSRGSTMGIRRS